MNRLIPALLALTLPFAAPALADSPRPMAISDLLTLKRLAAPTAAPDGHWVVWQQTDTDPATLKRTTSLWRAATDSRATPDRIPGLGDSPASAPAFTPDGQRLYFLSDTGGISQLWFIDLAQPNAKPAQASHFTADVAGFALSPDGTRVVVWGDTPRDCPTLGCADEASPTLPGPGSGRLYPDHAGFVRHWNVWEKGGVHSRGFVFTLDGAGALGGDAVALDGPAGAPGALTADTPTKPDGGNEDLAWAADSRAVYFVARKADGVEPRSTNLDIWRSNLDGKPPENLTAANLATDTAPAPSPDGKWLAWAAMARPGYESDRQVVMLRNLATGETRALTQGWDRSAQSLAWTPDSRFLIATADEVLDHPAFRIDPATGAVQRLKLAPAATPEGHISAILPLAKDALLYLRDSTATPDELWIARAGQPGRQISHANDAQLAALIPLETTRFSFTGAQGDTVWGMIHKPAGARAKLPVLLIVHGGPQVSFGDLWSFRWNARVFAEQGYAAVAIEFHGTPGYGQAFTDSINRDWGGKPLEDLKLGLAAALARDPQLDGTKACALGASYGGYMMNWIESHWADRFACLVQHDGVFDARAMAYETDELWFDEWEHGGHPYYEAPQEFEKWNPVNHVADWKTPMLVITSENDFRIPYTQGLATFTALQRRGVPSQLLVFPDEFHWVTKPRDSEQWHQTVFAWLDRWLRH
jgi:dipeptidyl aminopeptidase/acylaminoacyl peptidase